MLSDDCNGEFYNGDSIMTLDRCIKVKGRSTSEVFLHRFSSKLTLCRSLQLLIQKDVFKIICRRSKHTDDVSSSG